MTKIHFLKILIPMIFTSNSAAFAEQGVGYAASYESLSFRDGGPSISIFPIHSITLIDDSGAVSAGLLNAASSNAARQNAEGDIKREIREGKRQGVLQTKEYSYREVAPVAGSASRFSLIFGSSKSITDGDFWVQSTESVTDRTDVLGLEISRNIASFNPGPVSVNIGFDINSRLMTLNSIQSGKTIKTSTYTFNGPLTLNVGYAIAPALSVEATGKLGLVGTYRYHQDSNKFSLPWTVSSQSTYSITSNFRVFGKASAINDDLYSVGSSNLIKIMTTSAQLGFDYLAD